MDGLYREVVGVCMGGLYREVAGVCMGGLYREVVDDSLFVWVVYIERLPVTVNNHRAVDRTPSNLPAVSRHH